MGEYEKENKLAFEKEVLGVYLTGHPSRGLRREVEKEHFQQQRWTSRLMTRPEGQGFVTERRKSCGGMITNKTIKYTRNNKTMAFLTIEDLMGTVEVVVFPRDYERNQNYLNEDSKVFVKGRVSEEDDAPEQIDLRDDHSV